MQWVKIKDVYEDEQGWGKRPYIKHPIDEENETECQKRISCLCKWNKDHLRVHYGDNADLLYNQIDKLWYDCDLDAWFGDEDNYLFDFESDNLDSYILLDELNNTLEGKPESCWCWDFGSTLAKTAIPALDRWIKEGYSHPCGMNEDDWQRVLEKIKHAFVLSLDDYNNDIAVTPNMTDEEKQRVIMEYNAVLEEHKQLRKEAFALMADYYLDLWD